MFIFIKLKRRGLVRFNKLLKGNKYYFIGGILNVVQKIFSASVNKK